MNSVTCIQALARIKEVIGGQRVQTAYAIEQLRAAYPEMIADIDMLKSKSDTMFGELMVGIETQQKTVCVTDADRISYAAAVESKAQV